MTEETNMSWPQLKEEATAEKVHATPQVPLRPETFFKSLKEFEPLKVLKVAGWGPPESGKSYFGDTFPEPVYVLDTELAAQKIAYEHFPNKDIRIFECKIVDPEIDLPRPLLCLDELENAIKSLKEVKTGTIVIDTITDYWSWMSAYVESSAKRFYKKTGEKMRTEWSYANERYKYFIMRLLAMKTVNVVLLAQSKRKFSEEGKELSIQAPKWMYATPHWVDVEIHFWKDETTNPVTYKATIAKCRFNRAFNKTETDLTYDKLIRILRDDLKVRVMRD